MAHCQPSSYKDRHCAHCRSMSAKVLITVTMQYTSAGATACEARLLIKTCSATLLAIFMTGCAAHPGANNGNSNPAIVYAQPGQTLKQAVDSLPSSGGVVVLGIGTWSSGYLSG